MAFTKYNSLADSSRAWIYRSDRKLSESEVTKVNKWLEKFINQWTAHNQTLKAFGQIYHAQFVVFLLDEESSTQASGCSIDSQVRFIKEVGNALNIDFFDRLHFDFLDNDQIKSIHKDEVSKKIEEGELNDQSLVFDHLIKSKKQLEEIWTKPLNSSWHYRLI